MIGDVTEGIAKDASLGDRPVAGKTGTSENFFDAWFIGYTPQLVTGIWMGYGEGGADPRIRPRLRAQAQRPLRRHHAGRDLEDLHGGQPCKANPWRVRGRQDARTQKKETTAHTTGPQNRAAVRNGSTTAAPAQPVPARDRRSGRRATASANARPQGAASPRPVQRGRPTNPDPGARAPAPRGPRAV